jgi:hypothetical protein
MTNKGPGIHATCYEPLTPPSLGRALTPNPPFSGSMSDLVYQISSPVQMLRQIHSHQKVSTIYDLVDPKRRCLGSLFIHPTSPPHSSHDETAPLLGPPSKPDSSVCRSHATQPDDFRPIRLISQGVSGKVYLVEDKVTKKNFALKVIRKRSDNLSQVVNEKDALCKVTGDPWFLSLEASIHDDTNFYLITVRLSSTGLTDDLFLSDRLLILLAIISYGFAERPPPSRWPHTRQTRSLLHVRTSLCSGGLAFAGHNTSRHQTGKRPPHERWSRRPRRFRHGQDFSPTLSSIITRP